MTVPFPPGARVAAYLRDSGGAKQQFSIDRQRGEIQNWCKTNSLQLVRTFADEARTGTTTAGRDDFFALLAWLERKPDVSGVVVYEYERWARDSDDAAFFVATIRRAGYRFYSLSNPVPDGPIGRVVESIHFYKSEVESLDLSRRVRSGLYKLVSEYKVFPQSKVPPGFIRVPAKDLPANRDGSERVGHRLAHDPDMAPIMRKVFEMVADGYTYDEINARYGIVKRGAHLNYHLNNELYIGRFRYGAIVVEDFVEPIVDRATWEAVRARMQANIERRGVYDPRAANSRHLLAGLVRCRVCGGPMVVRYNPKGRYYWCNRGNDQYTCTARAIPAGELEERVLAAVYDLLDNPDTLQSLAIELERRHLAGDSERLASLRRAQADLEQADRGLANMVKAIREHGYSAALSAELARLEAEAIELRKRVGELEAQAPAEIDIDQIPDLARQLRAALEHAEFRQRQLLIRQVVIRLVVERTGQWRTRGGEIAGSLYYQVGAVEGELDL